MSKRVCREPKCPTLVSPDAYRGRCAKHQQAYEAQRGTNAQRGYDAEYRRTKAGYEADLRAGKTLTCVICTQPITALPVTPQHSRDRTHIVGPGHEACNLRDAGLASHGLPTPPAPPGEGG